MKSYSLVLLYSILFLASGKPCHAAKYEVKDDKACYESVCLPVAVEKSPLRGIARYRYWGFKLYTAGLYSAEVPVLKPDGMIRTQPTVLRLHYLRGFTAKDFVDSGEAFIKKNPAYDSKSMEDSLRQISSLYKPVKEGDEYQIKVVPGSGFELALNGTVIGTVPGDAFARVYMGIWVSEKYSLDQDFTHELVSGN